MAAAAEKSRAAAAERLEISTRQLNRYVASNKPLVRCIRDKIRKVYLDRDDLLVAHNAYGAKAGIEVSDPAMRDYVDEKVDNADDAIDQAEEKIDEQEALQESESERREVDLSAGTLRAMLTSLQTHCTKDSPDEADALYVESTLQSIHTRDEQFTRACHKLTQLYTDDAKITEIDTLLQDLKTSVATTSSSAVQLISKVRAKNNAEKAAESKSDSSAQSSKSSLRLQRTSLPRFSGNPRDFARFKGDYEAIVVPAYSDPVHLMYALKDSCLTGEAHELVKNINDLSKIWERLSDRYGDGLQILDSVTRDIQNATISTKQHNSDQSFIDFVDLLDRGVQDLEAIGQEKELCTSYTTRLIELKLPKFIKLKWFDEFDGDEGGEERFELMMNFLRKERKKIERLVSQREFEKDKEDTKDKNKSGHCNYLGGNDGSGDGGGGSSGGSGGSKNKCIIHVNSNHLTRKCHAFKAKSVDERAQLVKDLGACSLCLSITHKGNPCPRKPQWECGESGCKEKHSKLLHGTTVVGLVNHLKTLTCSITNEARTLLILQRISAVEGKIYVFWDAGSTISLVSMRYVRKHNLVGIKVTYDLITVNNTVEKQETELYEIVISDRKGEKHVIPAYGIEQICQDTESFDIKAVANLFKGVQPSEIARPRQQVDLLIGNNRAPLHPTKQQYHGNLVLYDSEFGTGKVVGGEHEIVKGTDKLTAFAKIVARADIANVRVKKPSVDFFTAEGFGVQVPPKCNNCKNCKECNFERTQMSRVEQNELTIIKNNLQLDPTECCWTTEYPYKEDPMILNKDGTDNRELAKKLLVRNERRLLKSPERAAAYCKEFLDSIERNVFVEVTEDELNNYDGPIWFLDHHDVPKESSTSTSTRLVVNTSLHYNGLCLNEILMKGPNSLNSLFGVLLNFRRHIVALVGDIKKMYQTIKTTEKEKFLRLLYWRNLKVDQDPKMYGIQTVNFGDRSAATIAAVALQETANIYKHIDESASTKIKEESFVDDIMTGDDNHTKVDLLENNIREILAKGGFAIKGFVRSGDTGEKELSLLGSGKVGRVLGVGWKPQTDVLVIEVRINLSKKIRGIRKEADLDDEGIVNILNRKLTRRMLLGVTNSCYDPYGLLSPITVQLKIELRELFRIRELKWDDDIPHVNKIVWRQIIQLLKSCEGIEFQRSIANPYSVSRPQIIMFVDGSKSAMCAVAYIRWELSDGSVDVRLVAAKTRVTPLDRMTIPKVELMAMVLGVRLSVSIHESINFNFEEPIFLSDSACSLATLEKDSAILNEFTANRVIEILNGSKRRMWFHVKSSDNIADIGTRMNAQLEDVDSNSEWQCGPAWLRASKDEWPISQNVDDSNFPEEALLRKKLCSAVTTQNLVLLDINKMKSYSYLLRVTARIIRVFEQRSLMNNVLSVKCVEQAEVYWLKQSMHRTRELLNKGHLKSLRPREDENGVIVMSSRAVKGFKLNYNRDTFPILCPNDPLSLLWMREVHCEEHSGVVKSLAKSRRRFWIVRGRRLAEKVRNSCYQCRLLDRQMAEQQMSPLPDCRLTVAPVFNVTSVDLFGPLEIKDTVKKRTSMKVWGFIATCAGTRAIHIDVTDSYSTDSILQVIRRFVCIRGSPSQIISDQGSQLKAASKDAAALMKDWNWSTVSDWAQSHNIDWKFVPAEGQHQNGLSESLIKSVKRSIEHVIGQNTLSFSEMQLMFFEIANVINSRPIGTVPGNDPECPTPLTPNDLLLGRSSNEVPNGPFELNPTLARRFQFVQALIDDWWQRWYQSVLPSLVPSYKWRQKHRNVQLNDICLIQYKSKVRSAYRLGRVTQVHKSDDGLVRKVTLEYRLPKEKTFRTVQRAVQGIAVIVPAEEQAN